MNSPLAKKCMIFRVHAIQSKETVMLNVRAMFWSVFGILFILLTTFTAYGKQEQESDAALSQSQFEKILEKIEESEDEMRAHVDKKFSELDGKFDELDDKSGELDKQVAVLNTKVNILIAIIVGIFTLVVAPILVLMLRDRLNQRNIAESREELDEEAVRRNPIDNRRPETEIA